MSSAHHLYVGSRCVALFDAQSRLWAQAVDGVDAALAALRERLQQNERPLRLRVWLSGGLCRPFVMPPVPGVKGRSELQRVAAAMAPQSCGFSGECSAWVDDGRNGAPRLAVGLQQSTLQALLEAIGTHRAVSVRPWWAELLRAAVAREAALPALAVQDCDSLTVLTGNGDGFATAATLSPIVEREAADAALARLLLSTDVAPGQELVARLSPLHEAAAPAELSVALASHAELSR